MGRGHTVSWLVGASLSAAAVALAGACSSGGAPGDKQTTARVFTNGGFETGAAGASPPNWTITPDLNHGITVQTPQTLAGLDLVAGGKNLSEILVSATGPLTQPDPDLGAGASLRWPRYGNQCAIVNFHSSTNFMTGGTNNGQNVNSMTQTMTIGAGDVDPVDGKVHVRFVVAPVLQNPAHAANDQPYYLVQLTDVTTSALLYSDFNLSGAAGIPWKTINGGTGNEIDYTDWQLVDITPVAGSLAQGDMVKLDIIASGCEPGGHFGEIYVDGTGGPTVPGLFVTGSAVSQVNACGSITYTLSYENGAALPATGVQVTFNTPPQTTYTSISAPGLVCTTPAVGAAGAVVCTVPGTVPAGAGGSFQVTVGVSCAATGTITAGNYSVQGTGIEPLLGPHVYTTVGCTLDSQCPAGDWCHESAPNDCVPTLADGVSIPSDPGHTGPTLNGTCTASAGALVCTSGVCDATNNKCGYLNGDGPCTAGNGSVVCDSAVCDSKDDLCGDTNGDGPCTVANGAVVCRSGVCDGKDDDCGYANGDGPCTAVDAGIVCRSGACSTTGECEPSGGCLVDADCPGGKWCDETTSTCTPDLPNGSPVPVDGPHTNPTLNGTCTAAAGALVCVSGVCDAADNECGYANGDGPCTPATGSAVCRSGTCSVSGACEPAGGCDVDADCVAGNWCDESVHQCMAQLANGTPIPTDGSHTSPTLNGTCTSAAATLVCQSGVCDTSNNECGYANGDGPCTTATGPTVCQSGTCSATGLVCIPASGCAIDADCSVTQYCNTPTFTCVPKVVNGQTVPTVAGHSPTLNGTCTVAAGAAACVSGVCDTNDNECGYANGDGPCTSTDGSTDCRSGTCSTAGTCEPSGGCNTDADCSAGNWCDETSHTCTPQLANGTAIPTDGAHTDPTLDGTCTAAAGTLVCQSGVCDTKDNKCGYANGDGPCTSADGTADCRSTVCATTGPSAGLCVACTESSQCSGATPDCNTTTDTCVQCTTSATCPADMPTCNSAGMCTIACTTDANCPSGQWCDILTGTSGSCTPKLPNGQTLPTMPSSVATCTASVGTRVCQSGVCDTKNNECGLGNGQGPCTSDAQCIDGVCDPTTMTCGRPDAGTSDAGKPDASKPDAGKACTEDSQCHAGDYCDSGTCTPTLPIDSTCNRNGMCQSADCTGGVCSEIVSSGSGVFCAIRAPGSTPGNDNWSVVGVMLGLAGISIGRRRRRAA